MLTHALICTHLFLIFLLQLSMNKKTCLRTKKNLKAFSCFLFLDSRANVPLINIILFFSSKEESSLQITGFFLLLIGRWICKKQHTIGNNVSFSFEVSIVGGFILINLLGTLGWRKIRNNGIWAFSYYWSDKAIDKKGDDHQCSHGSPESEPLYLLFLLVRMVLFELNVIV